MIFFPHDGKLLATTAAGFFSVNLTGHFFCVVSHIFVASAQTYGATAFWVTRVQVLAHGPF